MKKAYIYIDSADQEKLRQLRAMDIAILVVYGCRVLVRIDEAQFKRLLDMGRRVEWAEELEQPIAQQVTPLPLAGMAATLAPVSAGSGGDDKEPGIWLVRFIGPPLPEWVAKIRDFGVEIIDPLPPSSIMVVMNERQAHQVEGIEEVEGLTPQQAENKIHSSLLGKIASRPGLAAPASLAEADEPLYLQLTILKQSQMDTVLAAIKAQDGEVEKYGRDSIICKLSANGARVIAQLPQVVCLEPYSPPGLCLLQARQVTSVQRTFNYHGLDGKNERVGIADTGLDRGVDDATLHQDFWQLVGPAHGRVNGYGLGSRHNPTAGQPDLWNDTAGHGTHVSGIALGNGRASGANRQYSGVAYQAHLTMQSLLDGTGNLGGIPANLHDLFEPVYDNDGVRAHNNSWGGTVNFNQYLKSAREIDQFIWSHPDMVIVFAAGNYAVDKHAGGDGIVDLSTGLLTQGCNRNGITVGASENNWPAIAGTWGGGWPLDFPSAPLNGDKISDNFDQVVSFSGRGPTNAASGQRLKPDVLAPGVSILSCRSQNMPTPPNWHAFNLNNFYGTSPNPNYFFDGGTSMAAPHVTGICALIRQYLRKRFNISDPNNSNLRRRRPSAALIKAMLVHGARPMTANHGSAPGPVTDNHGPLPSNHQGWGRVDLRRVLFSNQTSAEADDDKQWLPRMTVFVDNPDYTLNGLPAASPNSRRQREFKVTVADTAIPLRATLVWTDYPGAPNHVGTLVNRLELKIIRNSDSHNFNLVFPAAILPLTMNPHNNNVQQIDVRGADLQAGNYTIRVEGTAINSVAADAAAEQDFALVISGGISHSDHANPGTMSPLIDLGFIDLTPEGGNSRHDGIAPSPLPDSANPGSPDIWVSRQQSNDPAQAVDRVEVGQNHYIYIRVRNFSFNEAANATVSVFWSDPTGAMHYPADWKSSGLRVEGATGNQRTITVPHRSRQVVGGNTVLADGTVIAGPFEWQPPRGYEQLVLFARVEHTNDPITHADEPRWDNNITSKKVLLQDNTTQTLTTPSSWDRFVFWWISGFGSPRNIEIRLLLSYLDISDAQIKPLPAGVMVEIYDYDPVTGDDKVGESLTVDSTQAGHPATAINLTFSTLESGERKPDLYVKVLRPAGAQFNNFVNNSFFASGAASWSSKSQDEAAGGFYREDFAGDTLTNPPPQLVIRPAGIQAGAVFQYLQGSSNEYRPLPQGVTVKIMDANNDAPHPVLATLTTDSNGRVGTIISRAEGYNPSIYFTISRTDCPSHLAVVDYFSGQANWSSRNIQGEKVESNGTVSAIDGYFPNHSGNSLVATGETLRFRLNAPAILIHLRFQYYDREAWPPAAPGPAVVGSLQRPAASHAGDAPGGAYLPFPVGTEVEIWRHNHAASTSPLVTTRIAADGILEATVPKGGNEHLDLFARIKMSRQLSAVTDGTTPVIAVYKNNALLHWDSSTHNDIGGTVGVFNHVEHEVGTRTAPLTFRLGAAADTGSAADNTDINAAPFILRYLGDLHAWLRKRSADDWQGIANLRVNLNNLPAATGSSFDREQHAISLNSAHNAITAFQPYTGSVRPDHWNRLTLAHHYGHLIIEKLFEDVHRGASPGVPNHGARQPGDERDTRIAFTEGWADYLAFRHLPDPQRPDRSAGQTGWRGRDNNGRDSSGEVVAVALANTLWHIDNDIVASSHGDIDDVINQHRFADLIWNPLKSLKGNNGHQVAYHLYRAMQQANIADSDLITPHDIDYIRQEVRRRFEANGMVFSRGRIISANRISNNPRVWRFVIRTVQQNRLHSAEMGGFMAFRMQATPTHGSENWQDLEPLINALPLAADQHSEVRVNFTVMRQLGILEHGSHRFRISVQDEFGAWDTFADDFTGNHGSTNTNLKWQRDRLHSIYKFNLSVP